MIQDKINGGLGEMMYVNGLGYVEDPTTFVRPTSQVKTDNTKVSFQDIFAEASKKYKLPQNLLEAVAYRESGFNPNDTSNSGAMGIMQLMPGTAKELGVNNPYNAYENIMGGAKYLRQLYDSYDGDLSLVLAAYNAGPGTVARAGGVPDSDGVRNYVSSVLSLMETGVNVPNTSSYVGGVNTVNNSAHNKKKVAKTYSDNATLFKTL